MGHAFDNATGLRLTNGYGGRLDLIASGWTPMPSGNQGFGCYANLGNLCNWIQGYHGATGSDVEQTADMFLGWVYGAWGSSQDGTRRMNWMHLWMTSLLTVGESPDYLTQYNCDEDTGNGC